MSGTIEVYAFETDNGEGESFTTTDVLYARERAQAYGLRVIAHIFEWADSETVWDFTGTEATS